MKIDESDSLLDFLRDFNKKLNKTKEKHISVEDKEALAILYDSLPISLEA